MKWFWLAGAFWFSVSPLWAQDNGAPQVEELVDAPPLSAGTGVKRGKVAENLSDDTAAAQLLVLGLRADVAFTAGRPTEQGFSLPGLRLNAYGEIARYIDYRVSLAPSREFSSVLVPQVLPVEAWVQFRDAGRNSWKADANILWKAGMFAPTLHPFFSADLANLPFPDYAKTHQAALLFRELGTEVTFRPLPGVLDLTAGVFNGSGIVTLNTNNARAITASAVLHLGLGGLSVLNLGFGSYSSRQSDSGSVNFISNVMGTVFATMNLGESTVLGLDLVGGKMEDATRGANVFGVTATAFVGITGWLRGYFRGETLRYSPVVEPRVNRVQLGPAFDPARGVRIFTYYEHLDNGTAAAENAFQCLVRISL